MNEVFLKTTIKYNKLIIVLILLIMTKFIIKQTHNSLI